MKFGFISVESHPREARKARVRVDGRDVTADCTRADDEQGYADVFRRDAGGRLVVDHDRMCVVADRVTGDVVIDFPNGLD